MKNDPSHFWTLELVDVMDEDGPGLKEVEMHAISLKSKLINISFTQEIN